MARNSANFSKKFAPPPKLTTAPKNGLLADGNLFMQTLEKLETKISTLDDKKCPLIQETLGGNWLTMSNEVVKKMEHFISELLVLRPLFCQTVIRSLIHKFVVHTDLSVDIQRDAFSKTERKTFEILHRFLQGIFNAYPTMEESGVKIMAHNFPYMKKGVHTHYCYVSNLLTSIKYLPQSKLNILHIIINKLVKIDGNIPRHEVEELNSDYWESCQLQQNEPCDIKIKKEDGEDVVDGDISFVGNNMYFAEIEDMDNIGESNQLVGTLDVCLQLLFDFLHNEFQILSSSSSSSSSTTTQSTSSSSSSTKLKSTAARKNLEGNTTNTTTTPCSNEKNDDEELPSQLSDFYTSCLNILFDKELLPSFGTNHVQFVFFYITSLHPKFPQIFIDRLWKKVTCVGVSPVLRIQAMSYIAGLLTRAKFVPFKTVKRWLTRMAEWANAYMDERGHDCRWTTISLASHGTFYAVCQAIFYVFAFRNKELLGSRKASAYTRTLNLGRLITSELNPLKACPERLAEEFVEAANYHQISYCRTVLERNQRSVIPTVSGHDIDHIGNSSVSLSTLESFFPFDEYLLPRSRKWIDPIYLPYDPYLPQVKIEKEEAADENEDSIEMELSKSYTDSPFSKGFPFYGSDKLNDSLMDFMDM